MGLKDDILILSPRKKFTGQLLVASLLIIFTETPISGFYGIIGITVMLCLLLVIFTLVTYVLIINAFNLIDGVDGLASGIILMDSVAFGFVFGREEDNRMIVIEASSVRAILPFLYFNFSKRNKKFIGDSGSMILGFIIPIFSIRFIDSY